MKMSSLRDSRHANIDSKVRKINSLRDSQVINKVFLDQKHQNLIVKLRFILTNT